MPIDYTGGRELGVWTFLKRDMLFWTVLSGILIVWFVFLLVMNLAEDDPVTARDESMSPDAFRNLLVAFCVVTAGFVVAGAFRYRLISSMVRGGIEVPGKIVGMKFATQGMYQFSVSYRSGGKDVVAGRSIGGLLPKLSSKPLREGQEVSLLVNEDKPGRYIILDLYLKPAA